jgi:exodeoxyribonuclease V gamma subunit
MLNLHFANRLETLADQLVRRLGERAPGRSAFEADEVIVPSAAITRRLIIELARRQGVCANVNFSYLARWLWQQTEGLIPDLPRAAAFDAAELSWRILAAFEDKPWADAQPRLSAWLGHADAVMRHELAVRVAALFEQYLTYRPEWLEAWFRNESVALGTGDDGAVLDQQWQAALWRRLAAATASDGRHPILALLQALDARGIGLAGTGKLPGSAHVFCLPTMPPVHLELLQRLGRHIDLHVYVLNPSQEFWFDVVEPRRLASLTARGEQQHHETGCWRPGDSRRSRRWACWSIPPPAPRWTTPHSRRPMPQRCSARFRTPSSRWPNSRQARSRRWPATAASRCTSAIRSPASWRCCTIACWR